MASQLRLLLAAGARSNITIQLLPFGVGPYPGMAGNFAVLNFADPTTDPPLGYLDGPLGGDVIDDETDVARLEEMFDTVRRIALSEADSRDLINTVLDGYPEVNNDG